MDDFINGNANRLNRLVIALLLLPIQLLASIFKAIFGSFRNGPAAQAAQRQRATAAALDKVADLTKRVEAKRARKPEFRTDWQIIERAIADIAAGREIDEKELCLVDTNLYAWVHTLLISTES